jgi:gluconate kinase
MVIILEGNECNFKSTIAAKLSKELGLRYIKGSSFETAKCNNTELMNHYDYLFNTKDNCIFDRSFYSNLVYADNKEYTMLNQEQVRELEDTLRLNHDKILLVFLHGDLEEIRVRLCNRGDKYIKADQLSEIEAKFYYVMYHISDLPVFRVDTSKHSSDDICEIIKEELSYD